MRILSRSSVVLLVCLILGWAVLINLSIVRAQSQRSSQSVAVGPQYDSTHVYVSPKEFDRFVASILATFGGTTSKEAIATVTPTPSSANQVRLRTSKIRYLLFSRGIEDAILPTARELGRRDLLS